MTTKKLEEKILALERRVCNCCKVLPTTNGIPTEAPTNGQTVKIDLSTGIIYYYDSDTSTWEVASGDTHMGNTNLVFTGPRTYDGAGADVIYNDLSSLDVNTTGAGGVQLVNEDSGTGEGSFADVSNGRAEIGASSSYGSSVGSLAVTQTETVWGHANSAYYLGDGFITLPPTLDDAQDQVIAIDESTGRLYRRTVASIGGSGALPYYEAILRIEDVTGDLQVTEEIANTFPSTVWSTNTPSSGSAQNGFELHPVGSGIDYTPLGFAVFGSQTNIFYSPTDGTVAQLVLYGNGVENIGVLPTLMATVITSPSNTFFVGINMIVVIRHYL